MKSLSELSAMIKKNQSLIDQILDLLQKSDANPEDAEQILLLIAGISAGMRGAPVVKAQWIDIAVLAWAYGAHHG